MIYNLRLKLSNLLFRSGKLAHPDISKLIKDIAAKQREMAETEWIFTGANKNE